MEAWRCTRIAGGRVRWGRSWRVTGSRLLAGGYTPGTVEGILEVLGQLGRWMQPKGSSPPN
jgi:hypothetical protein